MLEGLKPCPFCGGKNIVIVEGAKDICEGFIVVCVDCEVSSRMCATRKEAISAWNTRKASSDESPQAGVQP